MYRREGRGEIRSSGGDLFEEPGDGEVVFAAEVDAEEFFAGMGAEDGGGAGFGGEAGFAGGDEVVGEEDGGLVEELAFVLLGEGFGVGEAALEAWDVDGEAGGDGVVNGDFLFEEGVVGGVPEGMEAVGVAVWSGDDAELFGAAAKGVGQDGKDGTPDLIGMIVKSEFGEDEVGAVAADSFGFGGKGGDARAIAEEDF